MLLLMMLSFFGRRGCNGHFSCRQKHQNKGPILRAGTYLMRSDDAAICAARDVCPPACAVTCCFVFFVDTEAGVLSTSPFF